MNRVFAALFLALSAMAGVARADDAALVREANAALAKKDYTTAFSRFSVLAQHGHAAAQFDLGAFYLNGQGVAKDEKQAFDWFAKAAAQGHSRARQFLQNAAAQGNPYAISALGRGRAQPVSAPAAPPAPMQRTAPASLDDKTLPAQANAALRQKDYSTAFSRFSILAERGDASAQFNVGAFYYNGQGVARDQRQAYEWFARSAAQGNTRALQIVRNAAAQGNEDARRAYATLEPASALPATPASRGGATAHAGARRLEADPSGFLLGLNLGQTRKLADISNSSSIGVLLGYRFNQNFGLELAYNALYRNANANPFVAAVNPGGTATFDLNAVSLTGQYILPLGGGWSLLGDLGVHGSSFKVKSSGPGSLAGSSHGAVVGAKVEYDVGPQLGLRAGFDTYTQSGGISGSLTEVGMGIVYRF